MSLCPFMHIVRLHKPVLVLIHAIVAAVVMIGCRASASCCSLNPLLVSVIMSNQEIVNQVHLTMISISLNVAVGADP